MSARLAFSNAKRNLGTSFYLRTLQALGGWANQIWVLHAFDHPRYNDFFSDENPTAFGAK